MSRKVFISFLGTNNYLECCYQYNGVVSKPVRFVQEALIAHLCKDWTEKDKILIFCTSKELTGENGAKEINWLDNGQQRINCDTEKVGLQHRLADLKISIDLKPPIEEVDIEAGFSEDEIWSIFNTVYNHLRPADQIYFDVTHAFRSIPLFSIVLFNYARFMIGTHLESIVYGAFEKLGSTIKVRELSPEDRVAPVIDLTNVARLQEYNQIANGLKSFGKIRQIGSVINKEVSLESDRAISDLGASIAELDEYINTINLQKIKSGSYIIKFRNNYKYVKRKYKIVDPISKILDELYNETVDFVSESSFQNIEAAINWTLKHDMLMQAFPLVEEYIVLHVADMLKDIKPSSLSSKKYRIFISSILGMPNDDFVTKNWKDELARFSEVADEISEDFLIRELRPEYDKIREARNSLAHGNGSKTYDELKKLIPVIIDCIDHLNAGYKKYPSTQYIMENLC